MALRTFVAVSVALSGALYGQSDTLTLSAGTSSPGAMSMDLTLSSPPGSEPAALQWTFGYSSDVIGVSLSGGPSSSSAGKTVTCTINNGSYTCTASSLDSNIISNGVVASVTFNLIPGITSTLISFSQTLGVDPTGTPLTVTPLGGSVLGGGGGSGGGNTGPEVSSLSCSPSSVLLGALATCTVTLVSPAPAGGTAVALGSTADFISMPLSVIVPAGSLSATFTATALPSNGSGVATIIAISGGVSATSLLSVIAGPASLSSIACAPPTVADGDSSVCTIDLSGPAPTGGAAVSVTSSSSVFGVPATVTVPSGAISTTMNTSTSTATGSQSTTITASYGGITQTASVSATPPVSTSGLTCTLPTISGTQYMASSSTATCTVKLTSASGAPQSYALSSSAATLTVPASVRVPAGATSATFTATAGTITSGTPSVTLTARGYGATQTVSFRLAVLVSSLTCNPTAINSNTSTTCTVTLSQKASAATSVAVSTSNSKLSVPTSVNVLAGKSSATFAGTTGGVDYAMVTLTAALNSLSKIAAVSIGIVPLTSLTCTPSHLTAGGSATCNFTLVSAAPAGGETITISSSSAKLSVPSSMAVAAGATSGSFTARALSGYVGPVAVTAQAGGTKAVTATVSSASVPKPGQGNSHPGPVTGVPQRLSCAPKLVVAGSTANCELQLTAAAVGNGSEVALSASDASVHLPPYVQSRRGQSTLSFQAYMDSAAPTRTVILRAIAGDELVEERLTVQTSGKPTLSVPGKQYVTIGSGLSFEVRAASGSGVVTLSAHSLPSGAHFDASTGLFEWTPTESGTARITFSASDITQASASAEVSIQTGDGTPVVESVQNAASGSTEAVCSRGALATLRGGWLSDVTRVIVNEASVPIVQASATAVTFECPEAPAGTGLSIVVQTAAGRSAPVTTVMRDSALGIFTVDGSPTGQAVARILESGRIAMPRDARNAGEPAQPGDMLQISVTGLPTDVDPGLVTVQIGDILVQADWVRPIAGPTGVAQVGVTLPGATPVGDSVLLILGRRLADGRITSSQPVLVAVESVPK